MFHQNMSLPFQNILATGGEQTERDIVMFVGPHLDISLDIRTLRDKKELIFGFIHTYQEIVSESTKEQLFFAAIGHTLFFRRSGINQGFSHHFSIPLIQI
jgi:hypothetical protein